MDNIDLTSKEWCDIIFKGRNKDYGAYKMRKESGKRNLIAIAWVCIIVLSPLIYISLTTLFSYQHEIKFTDVTELSNLKPAENKHKLLKKTIGQTPKTPKATKEQKKSGEFCIKADKDVIEETAEKQDGKEGVAGVINIPADTFALDDKKVLQNACNANTDPKIFRVIEQLPEFPGGISAFMKWLTYHLKYPESIQQDADGEVVAQFIINKDGSISDLKITQSLNPDCDKEVLRVLKTMPKWKPGIQDGKTTRTQYVIPIVFKKY